LAMMSIMTRDGVDDESAMVLNKTLWKSRVCSHWCDECINHKAVNE
jgi:hypothetical protein